MASDDCFELLRAIRNVGGKLTRERDKDLKTLDLTSNQSTALLYLESNPGCQITDLRDHLETSHQAARALVERMRAKGLLEVVVSDSDGRARSIRLSPEGMERCAEVHRVGGNAASHALSSLSIQERAQLLALLLKIKGNLRRQQPINPRIP